MSTTRRRIGADRVYVVDGAQQGLHFAMSLLLSPGDEILIPNPGYPTFAMTSSLLHAVPVRYPLYPEHDFQPRIEDIEALITPRTKVLMLNSPSNPLGAVLGEDLTRRLVELARRHDLWIISDECYEAFTYDVPHVSPARFDSDVPGEARVFTSLTLSKTYGLTGLRIGALICPPGLEQKMNNVMESIVSCVASPSQYAALAALTGPQDYVSARPRPLPGQPRRGLGGAALQGHPATSARKARSICGRTSRMPAAGMSGPGSRRFLADSGVAFAPGTAFGSIGEGWIRIALCGRPGRSGGGPRPPPCARAGAGTAGSTGPIAGEAGSPSLSTRRSQAGPAMPGVGLARFVRVPRIPAEGVHRVVARPVVGFLERADGMDRPDRPCLRGLE